jgi:eukaryotic-like serine/threonine-protein kinase
MRIRTLSYTHLITFTVALARLMLLPTESLAQSDPLSVFHGGPEHAGVYGPSTGTSLAGVQWRVATKGDVIGSPAVFRNTVYIGSGDGRLYALDLQTGAERWLFDAQSPIPSTPAVGDNRVYFGTRNGTYYAVDATNGTLRWQFKTGADLPLKWGHESGDYYTSSPVYVDGLVIFGAGDGQVYAVDAKTGRERWRARTEGRVRSSPAVSRGLVYVGSMDGRIYCFELQSGRQVWRYETQGASLNSADFGFDRRTIQSSPAAVGGVVYVGSRDDGLYALSADTGKLRWRASHNISWIITTPAVADGRVYVGSSDGAFVQALDAATGEEVWRQNIGTVIWSSLAVSGDVLYFGDRAGRLLAIERGTGRSLWTLRTGGSVFSSPVVANGLVIFGSVDNGVYALRVAQVPTQRAVFFEPSYAKLTSFDSELLSRYLQNRGYQLMNAEALSSFLKVRITDRQPSVVVFATEDAPADIVKPSRDALLRQYLEAGGKVVWPGLPPLLWPIDPATGKRGGLKSVSWSSTNSLLDVDHNEAIFDARGVSPTAEGRRWGLSDRWRDAWSVSPKAVTTVLGLDEWGLAASWVRNYGGPYGTGFVRPAGGDPQTVFMLAEFRPN